MDKRRKFLIIGAAGVGLNSAVHAQLAKHEVEVISPDEATERGITITSVESTPYSAPLPIYDTLTEFSPPLTRRERRAQERRKNNGKAK